MSSYVRRAAFAALLTAPVLAVPALSASAAPATPATPASCPLPGDPQSPNPIGQAEGLIGNLSPAAGSAVAAGATISFLIADEGPFRTPLSGDVVVTVNGVRVMATAGAQESGVPITYADLDDKGSQSSACEVPFSFVLPARISGSAHIRATAYDGDGEVERVSWTLTVQTTTLPDGAVGGIALAALAGGVLFFTQLWRRNRRFG
ncbi:MAG: hypothetical protein JO345_14835 [Streptosporangiaceae bacterium]|nr:hypothetical protein [Streptosporangiaceae bacterium]